MPQRGRGACASWRTVQSPPRSLDYTEAGASPRQKFVKGKNLVDSSGRGMVDPQVKKARLERSIADENGCPGMHVLVSAAGDERAGPSRTQRSLGVFSFRCRSSAG
jgi:hypothetical protein